MKYNIFKINIEPMGAVRMTNRGKWVQPNAKRYIAYKEEVSLQLKQQMTDELWNTAIRIEVLFHFIPAKSNKTAKIGAPVTKKPDFDNLVKGICDAANKIVWTDDALVTSATVKKRYAKEAGIVLKVYADQDEWEYMV